MTPSRSHPSPKFSGLAFVLTALFAFSVTLPAAQNPDLATTETSDKPYIQSIRLDGTNVVVVAYVPANVQRVTLESRERVREGAWQPRAINRLQGKNGFVTFRLPKSAKLELIRLRTDSEEPLPAAFYTDKTVFSGQPGGNGALYYRGGAFDAAPTAASEGAAREVVESDIWKVKGDFVYFFNQYRGLQVIDHSQPDAPVLRGTFPLPASGEQMYLMDENVVVLLARESCHSMQPDSGSRIFILRANNGIPTEIASLPVTGTIEESRLVGKALYVASQTYRPINDVTRTTWEWGTLISSFDLTDPAKPAARQTFWYPGYGNVIAATDQFLFVASQTPDNWWRSVIRCLDISNPTGTMKPHATIRPAGRVADKFKMHFDRSVFTVISETQTEAGRLITSLENFSLQVPDMPVKLGSLRLGERERLHATRFDGDRVYIVTFFQIDPLWIVDLSDSANPRIAGELEVPGWSTYIHPMGDRLVAVGVETNRVAVSLFGVSDPAKPQLLSKVRLGENYSWSEANSDEKAFSVLPEAGLILVPYQGDGANGYVSRVQLIDFDRDNLTQRGIIEHAFQPRRAALHRDRILSITGRELFVVDASNRDKPVVTAETPLSWEVNRVFVKGDFLLEIDNGAGWGYAPRPTLRVARATDANTVVLQVPLTKKDPVQGATVRGERLYIAQEQQVNYWGPIPVAEGEAKPETTTPTSTLTLSVFDLSRLPELPLLGQTETKLPVVGWQGELEALWVQEGLQVWSARGSSYWYGWGRGGMVADLAIRADFAGGLWRPWWGGGSAGRLSAFDVTESASPKFVSSVTLSEANRWSYSSAFTAAGKVYLSHQSSELVSDPGPLQGSTGKPDGDATIQPVPIWVQKYFLDVVDYADLKNPTIRQPVNIPGTLSGLSRDGELVYTTGYHWTAQNTDWKEWLDASAYDGIAAHLIDSLPLAAWPHPVTVSGEYIFIGQASPANNTPNFLETWTIDSTGRFLRVGSKELKSPAQALFLKENLLVVNTDQIQLFNVGDPRDAKPIGQSERGFCWGYELKNGDGSVDTGFWLPLGDYGVVKIPLSPRE